MPDYTFSNVKALMQSVGVHLLPHAPARAVGPEAVYTVDSAPVIFVAKSGAGGETRVALKRLDWKTISAGARFRARVLSIFGLAMSRRTYLSRADAQKYQHAMQRVSQALAPHANGQQLVLARLGIVPSERRGHAPAPPPDGASPAHLREDDLPTLHSKVVNEFHERLTQIMPSLHEQYLHYPGKTADIAARKALSSLRSELAARLESFSAAGMSKAEREAIVRELGFEQSIARWSRVGAQYHSVNARLIAMTLMQVDYCLDAIPRPQLHIDMTADAVLGDLHGNCELLLHSLVTLGFFTIKDRDAWTAVSAQLRTLETGSPNNDWQSFQAMLSHAIEPAAGAGDRRLTLIGDVLAERRGNAMFMVAILAHMDQCGLNFDCMFGNHEGEFLSYFLKNRGKSADLYSMSDTGVRMDADQCRSLVRLDELIREQPAAVPVFERMVESGFLRHLKVASFSRDGTALHTHAFANGALLSSLFAQTGVLPNRHITEQIRDLNERFRKNVLRDWDTFSRFYHDGKWNGKDAPVSPLRAVAWNIGMDLGEYASDPAHPNNAGLALDPRFVYAVHGHCDNVASRVSRLSSNIAEVCRLSEEFMPLTDTRSRFLKGVRPYLPALNRALSELNGGTPFRALDLLAPFVARRLQELLKVPERQAETTALVNRLKDRNIDAAARAQALSDFWNSHCRDKQALALATLPEPVRSKLLANVSDWLGRGLELWQSGASLTLDMIRTGADAQRRAFGKAVRRNIGIGDPDAPLTRYPLQAYVNGLKRRFFSLDGTAGASATDIAFSRLVLVTRGS